MQVLEVATNGRFGRIDGLSQVTQPGKTAAADQFEQSLSTFFDQH